MKTDVFQIDNVAMKVIVFEAVGDFMAQHVHVFDHEHYVLDGEVTVICPGEENRNYKRGEVITLKKHKAHKIIAVTADARSMCCHILEPDEVGNFDFETVIV